ncbi:CBS domain-containing protein [Bacillus sp. SCS-153A]|uniref:CBS domain-containing protein n=1 Tax=Rossellomorea sedimentorum TaxID=3115294 RepID=UPI003905E316
MSNIQEVMTQQVETCSPSSSLIDVAKLMKDLDIGAVPVSDNNQLKGILTDRDIVIYGLAEKGNADLQVKDIMTESVDYVTPETDINEAYSKMAEKQIRRLPVLDQNNQVVGIVSLGDLAVKLNKDSDTGDTLEAVSRPIGPDQ